MSDLDPTGCASWLLVLVVAGAAALQRSAPTCIIRAARGESAAGRKLVTDADQGPSRS